MQNCLVARASSVADAARHRDAATPGGLMRHLRGATDALRLHPPVAFIGVRQHSRRLLHLVVFVAESFEDRAEFLSPRAAASGAGARRSSSAPCLDPSETSQSDGRPAATSFRADRCDLEYRAEFGGRHAHGHGPARSVRGHAAASWRKIRRPRQSCHSRYSAARTALAVNESLMASRRWRTRFPC